MRELRLALAAGRQGGFEEDDDDELEGGSGSEEGLSEDEGDSEAELDSEEEPEGSEDEEAGADEEDDDDEDEDEGAAPGDPVVADNKRLRGEISRHKCVAGWWRASRACAPQRCAADAWSRPGLCVRAAHSCLLPACLCHAAGLSWRHLSRATRSSTST